MTHLKRLRYAGGMAMGIVASLLALVMANPRPADAQLYCWQVSGCSGNAACGAPGGSPVGCHLNCADGTQVQCNC
jgi:hypothetical protein